MVGTERRPRGIAMTAAILVLTMSAPATAGCDVSVRPAPASSGAATSVPVRNIAIGKKADVQRPGLRLSATLAAADGPDGPEGEDALFYRLTITVSSGSFVYFPSLLKYYGSKDKPVRPADTTTEGDTAPVLILSGATVHRTVVVSNPASGPNGVLMVALYDQDGARLAVWSGK